MSYQRVIPRDLFNESKLLKCLGQLALLLHDYPGKYPITLEHDTDYDDRFDIDQDEDTGSLICKNIHLFHEMGDEIILESNYNSKESYPLQFNFMDNYGDVFKDDGQLSDEFTDAITRHHETRAEK